MSHVLPYFAGGVYRLRLLNENGRRHHDVAGYSEILVVPDTNRIPEATIGPGDFIMATGVTGEGCYGLWVSFYHLRLQRIAWMYSGWLQRKTFDEITCMLERSV